MINTLSADDQNRTTGLKKFFEPCVLYLLLQNPCHGYELKSDLESKCHCFVDTGNLYRALRKLERAGWVTGAIDQQSPLRMKRIYTITDSGKHHLAKWIKELDEQRKIITKLVSRYNDAMTLLK